MSGSMKNSRSKSEYEDLENRSEEILLSIAGLTSKNKVLGYFRTTIGELLHARVSPKIKAKNTDALSWLGRLASEQTLKNVMPKQIEGLSMIGLSIPKEKEIIRQSRIN